MSDPMTLREALEAIRREVRYYDGPLTPRENRMDVLIDAALFAIDASDTPGRWWIEGQGVSTADYRVRLVPDPQPGEPNPWASPWSPT